MRPFERDWLHSLTDHDAGGFLSDVYRVLHKHERGVFSYWDMRRVARVVPASRRRPARRAAERPTA